MPELIIGVRLSLFDTVPWQRSTAAASPGPTPSAALRLRLRRGRGRSAGHRPDRADPAAGRCCATGRGRREPLGRQPVYNPHIQRPAAFPPSDGYPPPEDPLVGRLAADRRGPAGKAGGARARAASASAYTYLQDYLPHVAQAVVRAGWIDLGRPRPDGALLPELPADVLAGRPLPAKLVCRTFSDCTTAPRHGLRSGCYPLDAFYKTLSRRPPS